MNKLRQLHLFIGCFFAPLLLYFTITGTWQIFELHKHPRGVTPTVSQKLLNSLSSAHLDGVMPFSGNDEAHSLAFRIFCELMAAGFILTILLGVQMALQNQKLRKTVLLSMSLGLIIPIVFLMIV